MGYDYLYLICLSGDEFNMTFPHWEERYEVLPSFRLFRVPSAELLRC